MQIKGETVSVNRSSLITTHVIGILTSFIGPLLISLYSKDSNTKVHAKYALNWQINVVLYILVSLILRVVVIGHIILPIILVLNFVFSIIAAIRASNNRLWEYPLSFQFIKFE